MKNANPLILTGVALLVLTFVGLKYMPWPYAPLLGAWGGLFLWGAIILRGRFPRIVLINLAIVLFLLAFVEAVLLMHSLLLPAGEKTPHDRPAREPRFFIVDVPYLGYGPEPNAREEIFFGPGDKVVYNAAYEIGADALRVSGPAKPGAKKSALFFGGSFAFGQGLNDDETLPWKFSLLAGDDCAAYNFGFPGYGAHQMLSEIEHGIVGEKVKVSPALAVFIGIPAHIRRSGGLEDWGMHDPRYLLGPDGTAEFRGYFDDNLPADYDLTLEGRIVCKLEKSKIYLELVRPAIKELLSPGEDYLIKLYVSIIDRSRNLMETAYPGCQFHVLFWDDPEQELSAKIIRQLKNQNLRIHLLREIVPAKDIAKCFIPNDGHPTAYANAMMAKYLADHCWPGKK